ncbi:MAG TPA: FtsX-like permease family protein [Holophagaceae bacterium]|nr:FtsX-like permease family protein [Holophagaceae bacterium]
MSGSGWNFDLRMAWREARSQWGRLLLVAACLAVGFAGFFATYGFASRIQAAIRLESASMLGADASISARGRLPEAASSLALKDPAVDAHATVLDFSTMGGTGAEAESLARLMEARAVDGPYPLVGRLDLMPGALPDALRAGVLVEPTLQQAWGLRVAADPARPGPELLARHEGLSLGDGVVPIAGIVARDDARQASAFSLGPRIYLDLGRAKALGLVGARSRQTERLLLKLRTADEAAALARLRTAVQALDPQLRVLGHDQAAGMLSQPIRNLNRFIQQLGLATLLLALLGGWAILASFLEGRRKDAAILRCLGAAPDSPFRIFGLLALGLLLAALVGGLLAGAGFAAWLPQRLADLIPPATRGAQPSPPPLMETLVAVAMILLLVLPSLLALARVQPLALLRTGDATTERRTLPRLCHAAALGLGLFLVVRNAPSLTVGLATAAMLALLFALLFGASRLLIRLFRLGAERLPLGLRLALGQFGARPALTALAMSVMGLSLFLLLAAQFIQRDLVAPILQQRSGDRPNLFLIDVQADQVSLVRGLAQAHGTKGIQEAPIVRARLSAINGVAVVDHAEQAADMRSDGRGEERGRGEQMRTREQNLSWRDALGPSEAVAAGSFWPVSGGPRAEFSLEEGFAKSIGAKLGDELAFDVQGLGVKGRVTSLRKVRWQSMAPNFFILAHPSLLAGAPAQHLLALDTPGDADRAALQAALNRQAPNVSVIDITDIAARVDRVLALVALVARALAALMLGSSLAVLLASLLSGRLGRARDLALLRTLGAGEALLLRSLAWEFGLVGGLSALIAAALAAFGSSLYARFVLELPAESSWGLGAALLAFASAATLALGFAASWRALRAEPLAVLRGE